MLTSKSDFIFSAIDELCSVRDKRTAGISIRLLAAILSLYEEKMIDSAHLYKQ